MSNVNNSPDLSPIRGPATVCRPSKLAILIVVLAVVRMVPTTLDVVATVSPITSIVENIGGSRIILKGDVVVQRADYRGRLWDYPLRKGRILFWPQTLYRSDGAVVISLALYWARGHREPRYMATSLSDHRQAVRMYRKRMQPEQYFKDGKQRFGWTGAP